MNATVETYKHINQVRGNLTMAIANLLHRAQVHDASKLETPEVEIFDEFTAKLAGVTYGSEEYKSFLDKMKPALEHHYAKNNHHPEHFPNGIRGMSLLGILEMLCDWKATTMRHNDGNLAKSIEHNQKRFGYSDEFRDVLINTANELGLFRS